MRRVASSLPSGAAGRWAVNELAARSVIRGLERGGRGCSGAQNSGPPRGRGFPLTDPPEVALKVGA